MGILIDFAILLIVIVLWRKQKSFEERLGTLVIEIDKRVHEMEKQGKDQ